MMKLSTALLAGALPFFLFIGTVNSFFILTHQGSLLNARLDPIVSPANVSGHLHSFVGSSSISSTADYNSIRSNDACTTSGVGADLSSYWTPTLFQYSSSDSTFTAMNLSFVNTYYLNRGGSLTTSTSKSTTKRATSNDSIVAFPKGFRMLAGDAMARAKANTTQLQKVVSFVCLNYKGQSPQTSELPTGPCPDGMRAQIIFPSCWDGKNLDSADHKSHVSYPEGNFPDSGDCPASHPKRFMTLFYEFVWSTGETTTNADESKWVFANGDMEGVAFHGDFLNGWDVDVLQEAIDQCTGQLFNNLEQCAPLKKSLDRSAASKCAIKSRSSIHGLSTETVSGALEKLPGCNTIFNGKLKGKGGCSASDDDPTESGSSAAASSTSSPAKSSSTKASSPTSTKSTSKSKSKSKKKSKSKSKTKGKNKNEKKHKHKHKSLKKKKHAATRELFATSGSSTSEPSDTDSDGHSKKSHYKRTQAKRRLDTFAP